METNAELNDLLFELNDVGATKICICVCNTPGKLRLLAEEVNDNLNLSGEIVTLSSTASHFVDQLLAHAVVTSVVQIVGLDSLRAKAVDDVFSSLNFRRDFILASKVNICLWLSSRLLRRLISVAPDFWSRRTATYYFSTEAVDGMLSRIFGGSKKINHSLARSPEVLLSRLVYLEQQVDYEDIPKSRRVVLELEQLTDELLVLCKKGDSILVSLSLWNESQAEKYSQNHLYRFQSSRNYAASILENRNDILFEVARQIVNILRNYKNGLGVRLAAKSRISLLAYFRTYVRFASLHVLKNELEYNKLRVQMEEVSTDELAGENFDEQLRSESVSRFVDLLENNNLTSKDFFCAEEIAVLKNLYSGKMSRRRAIKQFGEMWLDNLQNKVRVYLDEIVP